MAKKWHMGIVGCGWAGEQHARAIRSLRPRVELDIVADLNAEAAQTLARLYEVPAWTTDYREVLGRNELDGVSLCLPHQLHAPFSIEAVEAGLNVLVEKPLATTLLEADAMIAAAEKAHVLLMVAENTPYDSTYRKVVELIGQEVLSNIFLLRISREHQMHEYLTKRPWFLSDKSAGIMFSGGIHDYRLLQMLAGDIEHVYALTAPKALNTMAGDDTSVALAGLDSGAAAILTESFSLRTPTPGIQGTVHGSKGSLWFSGNHIRLYTASEDGHEALVSEIAVPSSNTFVAEIKHFLDCLESGDDPMSSARVERKPLVAVLATYESVRRGQRIYLTNFETG